MKYQSVCLPHYEAVSRLLLCYLQSCWTWQHWGID